MAENVKVIVRCRPMNTREKELNCKCIVSMKNCMVEIWDPNDGPAFPKQFTFDSVYDQDSATEAIYNDICYPLIESVLEGYNATVFVYGQTGCGKSHTMEGCKSPEYSEKGIISRTFDHVFEAISVTSGVKYLALVSYLEIYNEQIRDLLLPSDKHSTNNALSLKENSNEGVTVPGLTMHPVHNASECEHFLSIGSKNRMIGATLMNQNSSRSHSIFTISIEQISNLNNNESIRKGKLNLVDLAGSERQTKTGATGDRLKEATKINLSLSALGNVISALVDGKAKHIPYRDSKLTRLLQDSLGGNTRTLMIACVGPASRDYSETLSTLRYANRAKNIHNKPRVNEDPKDTILRQYQEEIEKLKNLLQNKSGDSTFLKVENLDDIHKIVNKQDKILDVKRDEIIKNYQTEMTKLKSMHANEKQEKESVLKQIEALKQQYELNIQELNEENKKKDICNEEEILNRIEVLKKAIIGGEKADDKELSERRKKKKIAAERRASLIAHLLAKIDMNEDREILQNQYKDISQELHLKTEILRKYKHKVKALEKEITDIQGEFEQERQDYLETIRKLDQNVKLYSQITEKIGGTLKKDCNYSDLEAIKEQAIWLEDAQKFKLPDLLIPRTKLPPPGRLHDIQTAPARLQYESTESLNPNDLDFLEKFLMHANFLHAFTLGQNHDRITPNIIVSRVANPSKFEKDEKDDIISSYFQPTTKRVNELLGQSSKLDPKQVINTWRDFARRNKPKSTENLSTTNPAKLNSNFNHSYSGLNNLWFTGNTGLGNEKKPYRLEALPGIARSKKSGKLNTLEYL